MIITVINDDNVRFFYEAIGERYDQRKNNETYVGLVNDDDRAVGAAILTAGSGSMLLSYIGIEDESRRQGLGSMFIDEIIDSIDRTMFDRLKAILFLKDTDRNGPIPAFLKSNVFMERPSYSRRTRYDLKAIMDMAASADRRRFDNGTVVRAENLSDPQREMIYEIDDILYEDKDAYFDAERILSDDNRFGGIYIKDDRVVAALCASPFEDGVRIENIYASKDGREGLKELFDNAIIRISDQDEIPQYLYIDTVGAALQQFEDKLMGAKGISPVESRKAYVFERELGE